MIFRVKQGESLRVDKGGPEKRWPEPSGAGGDDDLLLIPISESSIRDICSLIFQLAEQYVGLQSVVFPLNFSCPHLGVRFVASPLLCSSFPPSPWK